MRASSTEPRPSSVDSQKESELEMSTNSLFAKIRSGGFLKKNKKNETAQAVLDHVDAGKPIYAEPQPQRSELPPLPTKAQLKNAVKSSGKEYVPPTVLHDGGEALHKDFLKKVKARAELDKEEDDDEEADDVDWDAPPTEEDLIKAVPKWKRDQEEEAEAAAAAERAEQEAGLAREAASKAQQRKGKKGKTSHRPTPTPSKTKSHRSTPTTPSRSTPSTTSRSTPTTASRSTPTTKSSRVSTTPKKTKAAKIPVGFVPTLPGATNARDFKPKMKEHETKYIGVGDSCVCIGVGGNKNVSIVNDFW